MYGSIYRNSNDEMHTCIGKINLILRHDRKLREKKNRKKDGKEMSFCVLLRTREPRYRRTDITDFFILGHNTKYMKYI